MERTKLAPDIPTSDEVGLKDFNIGSWYGVWAPRDTPDAIVDKLASAMAEVSQDPAFIATTTGLGIVPTGRGPNEFADFIKAEVETNTALLKDAGYKPE
jgi:tripartite-type tricarboxylate transporter receptor subunit TctC